MKIIQCLLLVILLLAPVSTHAVESKWYACAADSECVIVPHSSCFAQSSINAAFLADYKKLTDRIDSLSKCIAPPADDPDAVAKCVDMKCTIAKTALPQ